MHFRFRTLLLITTLAPPMIAGAWLLWLAIRAGIRGYFLSRGIGL